MPDASHIELNLNALYFRLAHLFVGTDPTRYYLRGVYCEPHPSGIGAIMAASSGTVMGIFYDREGKVPKPARKDQAGYIVLAPQRYLQVLRPVPEPVLLDDETWPVLDAGKDQRLVIIIKGESVSLSCERWSAPGEVIDGLFPDWRKVFHPDYETSLEKEPKDKPERGINPVLLQPFADAAWALPRRHHTPYIHLAPGKLKNGPTRITTDCPDFCGAIMPLACPVREKLDWLGIET